MLVTADDLFVESPRVISDIRSVMNYRVSDSVSYAESRGDSSLGGYVLVTSTGAKPINMRKVHARSTEDIRSVEEAEHTARWIISSQAHADYIHKNPQLFLPLFNATAEHVDVRYKGIATRWVLSDVQEWVRFSTAAVTKRLADIASFEFTSYDGRLVYSFHESKLSRSFHGNITAPTLQRAYYAARRATLVDMYSNLIRIQDGENDRLQVAIKTNSDSSSVAWGAFKNLDTVVRLYHSRPTHDNIQLHRATVLTEQTRVQAQEVTVRRQLAQQNFYAYWDTMKSRVRSVVPSVEVTAEQFATIPLQPEGTPASRTWGIEVETVRAQLTSRPAGWQEVYDGSLNGAEQGSCDCSCDECYECEHCNDEDNECYYSSEGEAKEFVSPVLKDFNSRGLLQLCSDLPDNETDTTPGLHVHVNGSDLTVTDVARLLTAYSAVAPLLTPLYHRQVFNYCNEMESNNIQWWLGAARKFMQDTGSVPSPRDICESQPATRYQDVNVHALYKHGTIEFRAMGPYYNYDHLVRWAWFVREMVNVSKLGLPLTTWTRCRSLLDVIAVLRKYGQEAPQDKQFNNINTEELALSYSEQ